MHRRLTLLLLLACPLAACASRTLTDETGRRVTLPDHPHRIVCLMPSLADDVFAVGAGPELVGVVDHTERPVAASKIPSVGSGLAPSLETILALHPDLILAMSGVNPQAALAPILRLGIPVFLVDPHGLAGLLHTVESVGAAMDHTPQARAEIARLQARITAVQTRVQHLPHPRVFISFSSNPIYTAGRGAAITEIISAAGATSITATLPQEWPVVSLEFVIDHAPDAIILYRDHKVTLAALERRPGWPAVKAVREQRAIYIDDRVEFSSPVAIDALEDLARQLHP